MDVRLLSVTPDPEALIEFAGRACYRSEPLGDRGKFIRKRIEQGHESIIEHASATFDIQGISRACSHQLVRHRLCSFSQESQRYVDSTNAEFIVPPIIASNQSAEIYQLTMERIRASYQTLRDLGVTKQDARFVLPNATATRIILTANFRELLHVFRVRISPHAQWEIRELCREMVRLVYPYAPNVFSEWKGEISE